MTTPNNNYAALDAWIDQHFDEEVRFLQALVRVPTDTPPGNNAPHAERTAELLKEFTGKMNERLVFWIGKVKPAQEPLIAQWAEWQYEMMPPWLEFQEAWTKELERLMKQRQDPDFGKELTRLLQQGDGLMDGRFTGYTDQSRQRTIQWLSALSQSMDLSQRAHLYTLLKDYAEDFEAMIRSR